MKLFNNFYDYIKNLNEKDFLKYFFIAITAILFLSGFIFYRYFSNVNRLKKEIKKINSLRQEAQVILSKDIEVKEQKELVDEMIKKGKNFKLIQYFDSVASKINILPNVKERTITTSELENLTEQGYSEVKLEVVLNDLNMKQLTELLEEFEKNERIYIKNLDIKKENSQAIQVGLVIATIQPKEEITEIME